MTFKAAVMDEMPTYEEIRSTDIESPLISSEMPWILSWCLRASSHSGSSGGACSRVSRLSASSDRGVAPGIVCGFELEGEIAEPAGSERASSKSSSRGKDIRDSRYLEGNKRDKTVLYCSMEVDSLSTNLHSSLAWSKDKLDALDSLLAGW